MRPYDYGEWTFWWAPLGSPIIDVWTPGHIKAPDWVITYWWYQNGQGIKRISTDPANY